MTHQTAKAEIEKILINFEQETTKAWRYGGVDPTTLLVEAYEKTISQILALIGEEADKAYKKGYIDGGITTLQVNPKSHNYLKQGDEDV